MQQNNQDMTGFQNSMRKNSWQKPKSLYETNDDEYQVPERDFDEEEVMKKIRDELPDLAAEAHKQFLEDDGTGHPKDYWGKPESRDLLATHKNIENKWHFLSDSGRDDLVGDFRAHIDDIHAAHMASKSKLKEETEEDAIIARYEAHKEDEILTDERLANIRHRESLGTQPSHPETVMDAARALVAAYDAFKLEQEKIKAAPPGPAWPDNRPEHFKKSNR